MILEVGEKGLLIPNELLAGVERVSLRQEAHRIVVTPLAKGDPGSAPWAEVDPIEGLGDDEVRPRGKTGSIYDLGRNPVDCGITDASVNHDHYIYDDPHGERS